MYVKVTVKNHGWFDGDDRAFERWLARVHELETNETIDETNETTDEILFEKLVQVNELISISWQLRGRGK